MLVPLVVARIIDDGIRRGNTTYVLQMGGVLLLLAACGLTFSLTAQFFAAKAAAGFGKELRHSLFDHIQKLSYTQLDNQGTSTLITRMTSDVNLVQTQVNMAIRLLLRSPFIVFGAMIMAFFVDGKTYPYLKKQASEETSLKTQASSPQALSFPAYPGDILCHVCKRDPVARQATPEFHR